MRTQARNRRRVLQQWPVRIASALDVPNIVPHELDEQVATLDGEIADVLASGSWGPRRACC